MSAPTHKAAVLRGGPMDGHVPLLAPHTMLLFEWWPPECREGVWLEYAQTESGSLQRPATFEYNGQASAERVERERKEFTTQVRRV